MRVPLIAQLILLSGVSFLSRFAAAAEPDVPIKTVGQVIFYICKAGNVLFTGLGVLSVVILLIAAFLFLTGGGNEEVREKAKGTLTWGIAGLIMALLAKGFVIAIGNALGAGINIC